MKIFEHYSSIGEDTQFNFLGIPNYCVPLMQTIPYNFNYAREMYDFHVANSLHTNLLFYRDLRNL